MRERIGDDLLVPCLGWRSVLYWLRRDALLNFAQQPGSFFQPAISGRFLLNRTQAGLVNFLAGNLLHDPVHLDGHEVFNGCCPGRGGCGDIISGGGRICGRSRSDGVGLVRGRGSRGVRYGSGSRINHITARSLDLVIAFLPNPGRDLSHRLFAFGRYGCAFDCFWCFHARLGSVFECHDCDVLSLFRVAGRPGGRG